MDNKYKQLCFKLRRFDLTDEPEIEESTMKVHRLAHENDLKQEILSNFNISLDNKVMKLRNAQQILIPMSFLIDTNDSYFYLDIANITYNDNINNGNLLQDAYLDAVRQKVKNLELRIAQTELLLPQLEWRRQASMEDTVNALNSKVAFLNRRFDQLLPNSHYKLPAVAKS